MAWTGKKNLTQSAQRKSAQSSQSQRSVCLPLLAHPPQFCGYTAAGFLRARNWLLTYTSKTAPSAIETRLAVCALLIPKKERGLMRMNSIKNRAKPVRIRYREKISPLAMGSRKYLDPPRQRMAALASLMKNS